MAKPLYYRPSPRIANERGLRNMTESLFYYLEGAGPDYGRLIEKPPYLTDNILTVINEKTFCSLLGAILRQTQR